VLSKIKKQNCPDLLKFEGGVTPLLEERGRG
jgi:hypothetical protein